MWLSNLVRLSKVAGSTIKYGSRGALTGSSGVGGNMSPTLEEEGEDEEKDGDEGDGDGEEEEKEEGPACLLWSGAMILSRVAVFTPCNTLTF